MPATQSRTSGELEPGRWPGERLGLPETGPNSIGRLGRRLAALAVDWASAMIIALVFLPYDSMLYSWLTLGIFAVLQVLFIPTIGGSVGHRLVGLRVVPVSGGWVGFWRPIVRTALLAIVVPAAIWDSDQRGFHDKLAGTVLIRA
ncbi:RDD family protein [Agromyces sp. NPDC049794]|uniref:RDD family protein n=1 Tax=unclassified Agromyces TaxID=2639701 RepID=UPI0033E87E15